MTKADVRTDMVLVHSEQTATINAPIDAQSTSAIGCSTCPMPSISAAQYRIT
jgi:hypothetical protein